jgi:hypothetical protein
VGNESPGPVAAADAVYKAKIYPFLLNQMATCLPRDIPTHTESILCAVDHENKGELLAVLESRQSDLTSAQLNRFKKVLKHLGQI